MRCARPEVADVLREHQAVYRGQYAICAAQAAVLSDLTSCRTAVQGGHKLRCDRCGKEDISYNSCRNRHCPKCQGSAAAEWLAKREEDLLETPYFHVVFTLPRQIAPIALQNKRVIYNLLFAATSHTLQTIAGDPRHLGAKIGFHAVLHTWGQNLLHHPHVHCVIPGGGLAPERDRWIACRPGFFLPVPVLRRFFRGAFLRQLRSAFDAGELAFHGKIEPLAQPARWASLLSELSRIEWVVYAKPPFGGPSQVLKYLARYTHRVAISNQRIVSAKDGHVSFLWKDYAHGNRTRIMTLDGVEFVRRFLLHALPKGFVRIRHFGFLANSIRRQRVALIRQLLGTTRESPQHHDGVDDDVASTKDPLPQRICTACGKGTMQIVAEIPSAPWSRSFHRMARPPPPDFS